MNAVIQKTITTILWDLDGTLLDSVAVFEEVLGSILPGHAVSLPSHARILANFHGSLTESIANICQLSGNKLDRVVASFIDAQDSHYEFIEHHLLEDARLLAQRAHAAGKRQILVTNREHAGRLRGSPRSIVQHSELAKYIDVVISGDDSEHRKPNAKVMGNMNIMAEQTIVIGDQHVDAEFAYNLGCSSVIVQREAGHNPMARAHDAAQLSATLVTSLNDVVVETDNFTAVQKSKL